MSHSRGLKRKSNFLQAEGKTSAYARFMQELEEERQKKERLEWYLHEVMKEKEALSRFDDEASSSSSSSVSAAVEAFLAQSSCASTSTSTTATSSSPSATTSAGHTTYASTDYNRWVSTAQTAAQTATSSAQSTAATSTTATEQAANTNNNDVNNNNNDEECCARCGRQYLESQKTCRCRNFESVKKRQRCLSRFVRTGHMLEVSEPDELAELSVPFFDLNSFHFVEPTTTTSTSTSAVDTSDNVSDEDFLRMILEDVGLANEGVAPAAMTKPEPASLGEKSQRRRRASFISTSSGWDSTSAAEEGNYFAPASSTGLVFGY